MTVRRKTGLLRSVTVWFIYLNGKLFVRITSRNHWYKNLKANPKVKGQVGGLEFSAEAKPVENEETIRGVREVFRRKYRLLDLLSGLRMRKGEVFLELVIGT